MSGYHRVHSSASASSIEGAKYKLLLLRYTQSMLRKWRRQQREPASLVDQQLCRWLLLCLDRPPSNQLTMTQELIVTMLGVRREGATAAAGKLQKLGVIEYGRGQITVLDRPKLEKLSCECYAVVKRERDRLLPYPPRQIVPPSSAPDPGAGGQASGGAQVASGGRRQTKSG